MFYMAVANETVRYIQCAMVTSVKHLALVLPFLSRRKKNSRFYKLDVHVLAWADKTVSVLMYMYTVLRIFPLCI